MKDQPQGESDMFLIIVCLACIMVLFWLSAVNEQAMSDLKARIDAIDAKAIKP